MSIQEQKALIHEIIENSMRQGGRYVTAFFSKDSVHVSVYPLENHAETADIGTNAGGVY